MKKLFTFIITSFVVSYSLLAQNADVASNLSLSDIGDFNGAADMAFAFNEATGDTTVSEYRAIIVKASATFNVDSAILVGAANYRSYSAPLAANVVDTLAANATDSDGDLVVPGVSYNLYVLSIADGVFATNDSLSGASNAITLTDPIYSIPFVEGFEGGSIPTDWTIIDNDGDGNDWEISSAANGTFTIGNNCISSASWAGSALNPDNYLLLPAIDMSTADIAKTYELAWYIYAQDQDWADEKYTVYIDTVPFDLNDITNSGVSVFNETLTTSDNYMKRSVSINSYIGDTIWIAFRHHNVSDEFRINLDDIKVDEKPAFDISLNSVDYGLNYTRIPKSQASGGVKVSASVTNNGANTATNVTLNLNVNSGEYTDNSAGVSMNSNATQNLSITDPFVPTDVNIYDLGVSITMDDVDANTSDNSTNFEFEVTDTIYTRGFGAQSILGAALADYNNNEYGMLFEIFNNDTASSISIEIVNPIEDALVQVKLYEELSPGDFLEVAASDTMYIPLDIPQDEVYVLTLPLSFAPVLSGVNYLATVVEINGAESIGMTVDAAPYAEGVAYTSSDANANEFQLNDAFWTGSFLWPISLNVGENVYTSVKEKVEMTSISLMPNPAKDMVTLTSVRDYKTINVVDVTGKTVMTVANNAKNNVTLDVSTLEAGVYIVKATGDNVVATERLIIE